jgi:hypothetical protein
MTPTTPILFLFILALPIACVSWTVTHEELFREPHDYCVRKSRECTSFIGRKFYYLLTCEYCFSHYVTLAFLLLTRYQLLYPGWRGYVIGEFALVWISNQYISIYNRLRLTIRNERVEIETKEEIREQTKNRTADGRSIAGLQTRFNTQVDSSKEITMSKPKAETNAISMLKKDHETVKGLFEKFEDSENAAEKQKVISEAIHELKIHATIEEEIFYPALRSEWKKTF